MLRDYLRDVPRNLPHEESVHALQDAFVEPAGQYTNVAQGVSRNTVCFHSEEVLRTLFGEDYCTELMSRYFAVEGSGPCRTVDDADPFLAGRPDDLRIRVDRFAVVAYSTDSDFEDGRPVLRGVFLRGGLSDVFDSPAYLVGDEHTRALELFRLRESLMNRRQAVLTADHLNQFSSNDSELGKVAWRVVVGPGLDGNGREWLDTLGGKGLCLGGLVGANDEWRLGKSVMKSLRNLECVTVPRANREQVFSYHSARYVLPPRYEVFFKALRHGNGVAAPGEQMVLRKDECAASRAMAEMSFEAQGHRSDVATWTIERIRTTPVDSEKPKFDCFGAATLIQRVGMGKRFDYSYVKSLEKSVRRYSHALEKDEALKIAALLRKTSIYEDIGVRMAPRTLKLQEFSRSHRSRGVPPFDLELELEVLSPFEEKLFERANAAVRTYVAVTDLSWERDDGGDDDYGYETDNDRDD